MDKEQFDHIEILFRQAAMNVSPSASEEAWRKMEILLDREFDKKRRRAFIWWWPATLFFLFLGGTIFYYNHSQPVNNGDVATGISPLLPTVDRTENHNKESGFQQLNQRQNTPETSGQRMLKNNEHQSEPSVSGKQSGHYLQTPAIVSNSKSKDVSEGPLRRAKENKIVLHNVPADRFRSLVQKTSNNQLKGDQLPGNTLKAKLTLPGLMGDTGLTYRIIDDTDPFVSKIIDNKSLVNLTANASNTSIQVKKARRFYFVAAIAPNASAVRKIQVNEINSRYGLTAGYRLTKKLSLQTGVYAGRMAYTAGDGDYTIKPGSYISKIIKINADCYFYNFPLSLRYHAFELKKYNLYAVGGLSSFWSKNETYDYHFLNRYGMYRSMVSTYKNNKSLFSAVNLSLGVERNLSKVLYLQAEPYLLVPVSGVGEGKVKLHSAGLQFGIRYEPLRK